MSIRVGLVGTGTWARSVHAPGLAVHPAVQFAGVWGRSAEPARRLSNEFDVRHYQDVDELIDDVDAVVFAIAPGAQTPLATRAVARGKHVLLEKPVAESPEEAEQLSQAVQRGRVAAVVCLPRFFDPRHAAWLESVRAKHPTGAHVTWAGGAMLPGSPYAGGWRASSGELFDVGPHIISQLEYVLGPISASRLIQAGGPTRLTLTHRNGAESRVSIDLWNPGEEREQYTFFNARRSDSRNQRIDFAVAYGRIVDQLALEAEAAQPRTTAPWGIEAAARGVSVLADLRTAAAHAGTETAVPA